MSEPRGMTLNEALWGVAIATLGLAALLARPDARGVAGLVLVGQALTALAIGIEPPAPLTPAVRLARKYTVATLSVALVGEGSGSVALSALREPGLALWFLLGMSFAAAAIVATLRRVPGDNVFACQLFYHGTFLLPLVVAFLASWLATSDADAASERPVALLSMGLAVLVFRTVWIPLLFVALAAVLAYNLTRPKAQRELGWSVLLAHQAAFVVLVFRWAADGL